MRVIDFSDGYTSVTAPSGVTSSTVTGSLASPTLITAAGGVIPAGVSEEVMFIAGNGSAINVTANPQITAGTLSGQRLTLIGCSNTNTVLLEEASDLKINGDYTMLLGSVMVLIFDGTNWREESRNDI